MPKTSVAWNVVIVLLAILLSMSCNRKSSQKIADQSNTDVKGSEDITLPAPTLVVTDDEIELPKVHLMLRLERRPCYGECPVFELKVYSDGRAMWRGESYCPRIGYYEAFLPKEWREQLMTEANLISYFSLPNHYPLQGPYLSELPTTITYLNDGIQEHSITQNYLTPKELLQFQEEIERLAENLLWEKVREQN
ncbi:MAG: DUF6438 domain-containing protein [Saprospiraceae bacterium]